MGGAVMSRTTKTVLFIVVCYLIVGTLERQDYDSLDYNPYAIEYNDDYNGPDEEQLTAPLEIRS